ncbi:MAG: hypothetical protein AVDCRST_MAG87-3292 [uncultured Thermomicrobiales bacterium]|uniref:Uncharacterized protein n=1 Tax=uncultured Thermomicrobiales bacterium TaxID=1645740 RepID=A0A6J4VIY0_9BACT|nr:MAG: hypothetical protein AVDCRST_MAG87-3292 [uncultured Thermomicrobiales bacterium]
MMISTESLATLMISLVSAREGRCHMPGIPCGAIARMAGRDMRHCQTGPAQRWPHQEWVPPVRERAAPDMSV